MQQRRHFKQTDRLTTSSAQDGEGFASSTGAQNSSEMDDLKTENLQLNHSVRQLILDINKLKDALGCGASGK